MNLKECKFVDKVAIDFEGNLDDSINGDFGYRVFYSVPKVELAKVVEDLPINCDSGEFEFTVDKNGNQVGEVLLWTVCYVSEDEDSGKFNHDFIYYEKDISPLVDDFNKREEQS